MLNQLIELDPEEATAQICELAALDRAALFHELPAGLATAIESDRVSRFLLILQHLYRSFAGPEAVANAESVVGELVGALEKGIEPKARIAVALSVVLSSAPTLPSHMVDRALSILLRKSTAEEQTSRPVVEDILRTPGPLASRRSFRRLTHRVLRGRGRMPDGINVLKSIESIVRDRAGDWYLDPWNWPEEQAMKRDPALVLKRLDSGYTADFVPIDVLKSRHTSRPAVVLDPLDQIAAQALVDYLSPLLLGHLPDWVYGWRLSRERAESGVYASERDEWIRYRQAYDHGMRTYKWVLKLDVKDFFSSVPVGEMIGRMSGLQQVPAAVLDRLGQYLFDWDEQPGRSGIPQRARFSSLLAQWYLAPVDKLLLRRARWQQMPIRWMDDICVFSNDHGALSVTAGLVEEQLYGLGLSLNASKCTLQATAELGDDASTVLGSMLSNLASGPPQDPYRRERSPIDLDALEKVLAKVSELGDSAPRSAIAWLARVLKKNERKVDLQRVVEARERLVHGADRLAWLFAQTGSWKHLDEWYVGWVYRRPISSDWTSHAWAQMFTPGQKSIRVQDFFARSLTGTLPLALVPVAVHRLAAWDKPNAVDVFRAAAAQARHPFVVRGLALGAVDAGLPKAEALSWIHQFSGMDATSIVLEER